MLQRLVLLLVACAHGSWAVTYPVPDAPQEVAEDDLAGTPVTWVAWGAAGGAQARDPALMHDEQEGFRRFLHSPELNAALLAAAHTGAQKELTLLRDHMAQWRLAYCTQEQPTAYPRSTHVLEDRVPLPSWAWGTPMEIRRASQILIFDDRDPAQRTWVLHQCHAQERISFAYCTGWRSGDDRDRFWRAHPVLSVHPVATDAFAQFYGVIAYPVRIRFDTDTMQVDQGMDP